MNPALHLKFAAARRVLILCAAMGLAGASAAIAAGANPAPSVDKEVVITPMNTQNTSLSADMKWYPASKLRLEGKGFKNTPSRYSRLPKDVRGKVTKPVWFLSHQPAGLTIRFLTDATSISACWDSYRTMNHMARTGSTGLDLYIRRDGKWQFCGTGIPKDEPPNIAMVLRDNLLPQGALNGVSEYLLFLPTYSELKKLEIGLNPGAKMICPPALPADELPIVFYGTSITQGGCASRAGMNHPAILRRWLDWPVINLGFSGSGKCEPIMADLMARIPASIYVIETIPNMTPTMVSNRMPAFVKKLRKLRPDTPIVMVESPNIVANADKNAILKGIFEKLTKEGIGNLHYLSGDVQQAGPENCTVDGVHPTDLGFYRMAEAYMPVLKPLLPARKDR